jgi:deoxycytidylate deaminase
MIEQEIYKKSLKEARKLRDKLTLEEKKQKQYHFSFLWVGKTLVFSGRNRPKSHPTIPKYYKSKVDHIHAELDVLLKASRSDFTAFSKSRLVVIRLSRRNKAPVLSAPCSGCRTAIKSYGVKKVVYSISECEFGVLVVNQ